jgi:uncharacterized protein (DUF736 family)
MDGGKLLKIAGLYKQKSKRTGKTYLTGKLNFQSRMLVLPNDKKQADNEPDFNVFLVAVEEKPKPTPQTKPADDDL